MRRLSAILLAAALGLVGSAAVASAQTSQVTIVHGIPGNGLGLDPSLPVDVHISGLGCALTDFRFRDVAGPLDVPAGSYDVEIRLRDVAAGDCGGAIAVAVPGLPLLDGESSTVIAHLDAAGAPTASKFVNDLSASPPGESLVSVRHTAEAPAVDIRAFRFFSWFSGPRLELEGVENGQSADADLYKGWYFLTFSPAGGKPVAFDTVFVPEGESVQLHAVGSLEDGTFQTLVTSQEQEPAAPPPGDGTELTVIHGIPGEDLGLDPELPVDVWVSGLGCAIPDFRFADLVGPLALDAGVYDIRIHLVEDGLGECEGTVAVDAPGVPLEEGENSTIIAHLTADGAPTASKYTNDLSRAGKRAGRAAIHHTAAAPAVDIGVFKRFFFFFFPVLELLGVENPQSAAAELKARRYTVTVSPAGEHPIFSDRVRVNRGELVSVYAVGSVERGTFQLLEDRQALD